MNLVTTPAEARARRAERREHELYLLTEEHRIDQLCQELEDRADDYRLAARHGW